jgi:hypothetical protein
MASYKKKGTIGTSKPKSKKAAVKQAVAISLAKARQTGKKKTIAGMASGSSKKA